MLRHPLALLAFLLALLGCSPTALQVQAITASTIGTVANVALPVLGAAYEDELVAAVRRAALDEDAAALAGHRPASRRGAMDAAEAAVTARWAPVWGDASTGSLGAWETFRALQATWAVQIEAGIVGEDLNERVSRAYCDLFIATPTIYRDRLPLPPTPCPAPEVPR
jgi:hypothetical protein